MLQTEIFHAAWPPLQNRLGTSVQCQMPACSLWTEAMVPASQQVNRSHSTSEVLMIRAGCSPTKKKKKKSWLCKENVCMGAGGLEWPLV